MHHVYRMYLTTMSARFFHSADLEGLREGLTGADEALQVRPGAHRADRAGTGQAGRGSERDARAEPRSA